MVLDATENYLDAQDEMGAWIAATCRQGTDYFAPTKALYASWKLWAEAAGEFVVSSRRFGDALEARGAGDARYRQRAQRYRAGAAPAAAAAEGRLVPKRDVRPGLKPLRLQKYTVHRYYHMRASAHT